MYRVLTAGTLAFGVVLFGLAACAGTPDNSPGAVAARTAATADSVIQATAAARTVAAGTAIEATIQEPLASGTNIAGQQVMAIVSRNVLDAGGGVAIPGGASIVLAIAQLSAAKGAGTADGSIALTMSSLHINDSTYQPRGRVGAVPHSLAPVTGAPGDRNVVVTAGTPITITLTQPFKLASR